MRGKTKNEKENDDDLCNSDPTLDGHISNMCCPPAGAESNSSRREICCDAKS